MPDLKIDEAIDASLQNVIDSKGEVEIRDGQFSSRSNSLADIAKVIDAANNAGINLGAAPTQKRVLARRIG